MNVGDLQKIFLHPQKTYRRVRAWEYKRRGKCIVKIDFPRMKIIGRICKSEMCGREFPKYYAFFGIPYAQPPVGPLRFMPPQPLPQTVKRVKKKADDMRHPCIQHSRVGAPIIGSEDCLYLNIYLLKRPIAMFRRRPVLVYIHGGGFHHGSGDIPEIRPDAIIRQDLVFVTINYRLNAFGFLNMGIPECSGNAGLKDQTAALKWIKANIDRFGGDPNNVTITGHSAGATCVNMHMISPLSRDLFHKAIVMAGGHHCPWGYQGVDHRPRRILQRLFRMENEARHVLVENLKAGTSVELLDIVKDIARGILQLEPRRLLIFCGPSREELHSGAFMPLDLETLKQLSAPVPVVAGLCSHEGGMYILNTAYTNMKKRGLASMDELVTNDDEFASFLCENLRWGERSARKHMGTIREWYFPNLETMSSTDILDKFISLNTDIWFRRFYDNFRRGESNKPPNKFFVYEFGYLATQHNLRRTYVGDGHIHVRGPIHGDEETYLYNPHYLSSLCENTLPPDIKHVIDHMCSMWGNFCRTGIPTSKVEPVDWKAHSEEAPYHLYIGAESTVVPARLFADRWQRLNDLVDREPVIQMRMVTFVESIFNFLSSSWSSSAHSASEGRELSSISASESEYASASSTEDVAVVHVRSREFRLSP